MDELVRFPVQRQNGCSATARRFSVLVLGVLFGCASSAAQPAFKREAPATLLFKSGFEDGVSISAPYVWGSIWAQNISGADAGFSWPPDFWGGTGVVQEIVGSARDVDQYLRAEIQTVDGRNGKPTRALYQEIRRTDTGSTQIPYYLTGIKEEGDLYVTYWIKLQPDLSAAMGPKSWRAVFEWKTVRDYRFAAYIYTDSRGRPYWFAHGDSASDGWLPYREYWRQGSKSVPVPQGEWFPLEVFWHRSAGADGRIWMAVSGQVIVDHRGPNYGVYGDPINRIMVTQVYGKAGYYQWVDDIEIWDGFPCGSPPCAQRLF